MALVRMAELVGGLALASDLVNSFPPEKVLRTAILAVEIGKRAGADTSTLQDAFYVTLLRFLGCTGFAHEEAHLYGGGNDLATRNVMSMADATNPSGTLGAILRGVGAGAGTMARVRAIANLVLDRDVVVKHARAQCDTSIRIAALVGMSDGVRASLAHVCERFDGRGAPDRINGEAVSLAARLLHVADIAEIAHHRFGSDAAVAEVEARSGKHFDPDLAKTFIAHAGELLQRIEGASVWERFLACEPLPAMVGEARMDDVAMAFALFADLKSVYLLGHSTGVAALAVRAAEGAGLGADAVRDVRHAALLHDLGRVSVPNGIWDSPGKLGVVEWERVRLHAYYTERVLSRAAPWSAAARIAAAAHERLDASGYHRGVPQALLGKPERILAAADVLHALGEPRAHRPAYSRADSARIVAEEVREGRLCRDAVDAVLGVAHIDAPDLRRRWPRGLSDREVEVIRHLARGKSNKEIGELLGISARTVQNHVAHAYDKIGVYSRAGAALFVTEHGLLDP